MKNEELWAQYKEYTQDLSTNCRQLGFASAGICWFFKTETYTFPNTIIYALGFTVAFFILDMLQYFTAAILIRMWTRSNEKSMWEKMVRLTESITSQHGLIILHLPCGG